MNTIVKSFLGLCIASTILAALLYSSTPSEEREILTAFDNANLPIPEYVEVDTTTENGKFIKYGLGGRTCESYIIIEDDKVVSEIDKYCHH